MELADYLKILRRRWWLVGLAVVVCVVAAWAVDATRAPRYTSSSRLLVTGAVAGGADAEAAASQLAAQRAAAYAQLIQTGPGLAIAAQSAGVVGEGPTVTALADGKSPFIAITVEASSPRGAQALAAAFESTLPQIVARLEQTSRADVPTLTTLEPAALPTAPTSPQPTRDMEIAAVIGLVLGLASALLRETLDVRVRDSAELERLAAGTVLGLVPREQAGEPLPARRQPRSGRAEAYRHIRANLEFSGVDGLPASLAITSPGAGEGKSTLAANLAVVVAQSGRSVALVDADLRRPSLAAYFGLDAGRGLSDVLAGRMPLHAALIPLAGERISVLPSGPVPDFPSELVGSAGMLSLVEQLEQSFDLVIIDTPPVLPVSDALLIGVNVGGIVLVARMAETSRAALKKAVESVAKVNARLLGVVGNAVIRHEEKVYGAGYGYGYGARERRASAAATADPAPAVQVAPAARRVEEPRRRSRQGQGRRALGAEPRAVAPPVRVVEVPPVEAPPTVQVAPGPAASNGYAYVNGSAGRADPVAEPEQPRLDDLFRDLRRE